VFLHSPIAQAFVSIGVRGRHITGNALRRAFLDAVRTNTRPVTRPAHPRSHNTAHAMRTGIATRHSQTAGVWKTILYWHIDGSSTDRTTFSGPHTITTSVPRAVPPQHGVPSANFILVKSDWPPHAA
jgi:hypothetical protein